MLQHIKIQNLALLDVLSLEMEPGFTAVTGETGAGKSVLLGALSLLAGARTDKSLLRQGADQLEVEGALYFEDSAEIDAKLEALGLPASEAGVVLLRRLIHRTKMPKVQINGSLATLAQLQQLGEAWIDFHGPGEPQKLFQERRQLELLDGYAGCSNEVRAYAVRYAEWRSLLAEIESVQTSERLDPAAADFVRQQIQKIDSVVESAAAMEQLERDYTLMSQAQELLAVATECNEALVGDRGVGTQLSAILARMEVLAELHEESAQQVERARSVLIELQDLGDEVGRFAGQLDFDAEQVAAVTERMNLWQELRRHYGGSAEAVLTKREALAQQLAIQDDLDGVLAKQQAAADALQAQLVEAALKLRQAREASAATLAAKANELLRSLGFKQARLTIELIDEAELREYGQNRCRFLFAPNAGQELMPLNKIASSGETARVMLALKTVLAEADATPLLVFDEVDANVGGEVGRAVGAEMAQLAAGHQVFCVTHLPQVASLAHQHLVVTKSQSEDSTQVQIAPIHASRDARIEELARMLGDRQSASALAHAEELLGAD
ncbi:MAG: DNA repair protein RecN [Opitutales bacterium]